MRRILLLSVILGSALYGRAGNQDEPALAITTKSGQTALYSLSEKPLVTFDGDDVTVKTLRLQLQYKFADLETFVVINARQDDDAIHQLSSDATEFEVSAERLVAKRLQPGEAIQLFTTDGKVIATSRADAAGMAEVSLRGIGVGVVIVKTQSFTYKIQKQ